MQNGGGINLKGYMEETVIATKPGKIAGPFKVCAEMIFARGKIGISVMMELCQNELDVKENSSEWLTRALSRFSKEKDDVRNYKVHIGVEMLWYAMKLVKRVLEITFRELVNVDVMQFGFKPDRETTDAFFTGRKMQEEFRDKDKKLYCVRFLWILRKHLIEVKKGDRLCNEEKSFSGSNCKKDDKFILWAKDEGYSEISVI